jgi:hypothetical protein
MPTSSWNSGQLPAELTVTRSTPANLLVRPAAYIHQAPDYFTSFTQYPNTTSAKKSTSPEKRKLIPDLVFVKESESTTSKFSKYDSPQESRIQQQGYFQPVSEPNQAVSSGSGGNQSDDDDDDLMIIHDGRDGTDFNTTSHEDNKPNENAAMDSGDGYMTGYVSRKTILRSIHSYSYIHQIRIFFRDQVPQSCLFQNRSSISWCWTTTQNSQDWKPSWMPLFKHNRIWCVLLMAVILH